MRLLRIAALLDLDFAVGLRLQDGTKADSEGAKSVGGAAGKKRAPSTSRDGRKSSRRWMVISKENLEGRITQCGPSVVQQQRMEIY